MTNKHRLLLFTEAPAIRMTHSQLGMNNGWNRYWNSMRHFVISQRAQLYLCIRAPVPDVDARIGPLRERIVVSRKYEKLEQIFSAALEKKTREERSTFSSKTPAVMIPIYTLRSRSCSKHMTEPALSSIAPQLIRMQRSKARYELNPPERRSGVTKFSRRSARAASVQFTWPSKRNPSAAK